MRSDQLFTVLSAAVFVFLALILTTSVTYWISKSLCTRFGLETYRGALLIILSNFDCNIWRILVSDGLLHPHSSIPYSVVGIYRHKP